MAQPDILTIPFAANAAPETINPIPISRKPTDPAQQATWSEGFPRVTMQPMATGGIPPKGQDMNGALKAISEHIVYMGSGGLYGWSDAWVAAKGGYPLGAVLQSNDGRSAYVNIVEGNAVNFNTTPSSIGVSWLPFAGNGALSGKVDKTTQVIAGAGLTGGGALGGNRTLTMGTPGTLSGSTTNAVTADSHTHAVAAATESVAGVARIATAAQAQGLVGDGVITGDRLGDALNYHVLGMSQTWQDVTSQRFSDTVYVNSTGRSIVVSATYLTTENNWEISLFLGEKRINSVASTRGAGQNPIIRQSVYGIIPPGQQYKIVVTNIGQFQTWFELR